jgi:hypothetical protein
VQNNSKLVQIGKKQQQIGTKQQQIGTNWYKTTANWYKTTANWYKLVQIGTKQQKIGTNWYKTTANWYKITHCYNCDTIQMCNAIFPDEMAIKTVILKSKYENVNSNRRIRQDYKNRISIKVSVLFVAVIQSDESRA